MAENIVGLIHIWINNCPEKWLGDQDIGDQLYDIFLDDDANNEKIKAWFRKNCQAMALANMQLSHDKKTPFLSEEDMKEIIDKSKKQKSVTNYAYYKKKSSGGKRKKSRKISKKKIKNKIKKKKLISMKSRKINNGGAAAGNFTFIHVTPEDIYENGLEENNYIAEENPTSNQYEKHLDKNVGSGSIEYAENGETFIISGLMNCIGIMFKRNRGMGGGAIGGHFITGQGYDHPYITEKGEEFLSVIQEMLEEHDFNSGNTRLFLFYNPTNTRRETDQAMEYLKQRYHTFRPRKEACGGSGSKSGVRIRV